MTTRRQEPVVWWTGVLFAVGSLCFALGPLPGFIELVGARADGLVFFVGSLFFTSAAFLQWLQTIGPGHVVTWEPHRVDWWSSGVQLLGTVFFNASTFWALSTATGSATYDRVVWRPDAFGSICFLVAGWLAYADLGGGLLRLPARSRDGAIASVNLFGCVAFGVSAVTAYVEPATGVDVDAAVTNLTTCVGALAFLVGALLLVLRPAPTEEPA
jgi:xanthine/uracil/vitamin C permease (AzgA family)